MALSSVNVPPFGGDVGVVPIGSSQAYIWTHTTMNVGYIVASSHGTERLLSWNPVSPYIAKNGVSGNNPPIPSHQDTVQSFIMTPCYSRINLRRPYFNHQGNARWRLIIERLTTGDDGARRRVGIERSRLSEGKTPALSPRNILDSWSAIKSIICFLTSSCLKDA